MLSGIQTRNEQVSLIEMKIVFAALTRTYLMLVNPLVCMSKTPIGTLCLTECMN